MIFEFFVVLEKLCWVLIMVKVGEVIDVVINEFVDVMEFGDIIIIDGGNVLYIDIMCCEKVMCEWGLYFVGVGIFGGEEGVLNGLLIMFGGFVELY